MTEASIYTIKASTPDVAMLFTIIDIYNYLGANYPVLVVGGDCESCIDSDSPREPHIIFFHVSLNEEFLFGVGDFAFNE